MNMLDLKRMVTMAKGKNELVEWIKAIIIAVIIATVIRQFFFAPVVVDGYSMMPTLKDTDRVIANKFSYVVGKPKRFDIIVFEAPEGKDYIKRVIGLPGDKVEYDHDTLYINGKPYQEPYLDKYKAKLVDGGPLTESFTLKDIKEINQETVPEGYLFVMGDNRRLSKDSRHIGVISYDKILGKTNMVYWPIKDIRKVE